MYYNLLIARVTYMMEGVKMEPLHVIYLLSTLKIDPNNTITDFSCLMDLQMYSLMVNL